MLPRLLNFTLVINGLAWLGYSLFYASWRMLSEFESPVNVMTLNQWTPILLIHVGLVAGVRLFKWVQFRRRALSL